MDNMIEAADAVRAANLLHFIRQNEWVITNALDCQARRMEEAAAEAKQAYEAGQADPAVKAAQNNSMVTNNGYRQAVIMCTHEANKCRTVAQDLAAMMLEF